MITPADVRVHCRLTERITADEHERDLQFVSRDERDRASRFVFARDRHDYVAAHALLRQVLSEGTDVAPPDWTFTANAYGKPRLADGQPSRGISFNIAHTRGLVACVVADALDVGVDVEPAVRNVDALELAGRYFSPAEISGLHSCTGSAMIERFVELWTLKESYIKGLGIGLSHPLDTFGFEFADGNTVVFHVAPPTLPGDWYFALYAPVPAYRMALAVRFGAITTQPTIVFGSDATGSRCLRTTHR